MLVRTTLIFIKPNTLNISLVSGAPNHAGDRQPVGPASSQLLVAISFVREILGSPVLFTVFHIREESTLVSGSMSTF